MSPLPPFFLSIVAAAYSLIFLPFPVIIRNLLAALRGGAEVAPGKNEREMAPPTCDMSDQAATSEFK